MPPRWMVGLIVVFWLASTAWLVVRDIAPRWHTGEPPAFTIDLTDEVGANTISWTIWQEDEQVGSGLSRVRRMPDRTFELSSEFRFDAVVRLMVIEPKKLSSTYRVNGEGHLRGVSAKVRIRSKTLPLPEEYHLEGEVKEEKLHLKAWPVGFEELAFKPPPISLPKTGSILNPMHLVNKISGLHEGQSWQIPLFDPIDEAMPNFGFLSKKTTVLDAHVSADRLVWGEGPMECFRIDYREPGKKASASTWVRRTDGLVLQQQAKHAGMMLRLVRDSR